MKQVTIIGIGMGNVDTMTIQSKTRIEAAKVLIGATRMVTSVREQLCCNEEMCLEVYQAEKMVSFIEENKYESYAILMSGDSGFYSATQNIIAAFAPLEQAGEVKLEVLPGISSLSYFASKLQQSWEDAYVISMHGREDDIVNAVRSNKKTFVLTHGNVSELCGRLVKAGLGDIEVFVGENLSYRNENIQKNVAKYFVNKAFASITVMMIVNEAAVKRLEIGIEEEAFVRGKVPMTKSEVRAVIMSKLQLRMDSICYDVGAGTGSVSIEMAKYVTYGKVFAVEVKEEAIKLIQANKEKFGVVNLSIVKGLAPEAIDSLPAPTHVFIGGSKGNMKEILTAILSKTKRVQLVISAIALETLQETLSLFTELELSEVEVTQVAISKAKKVGEYHMMTGQNPIYIICGRKEMSSES